VANGPSIFQMLLVWGFSTWPRPIAVLTFQSDALVEQCNASDPGEVVRPASKNLPHAYRLCSVLFRIVQRNQPNSNHENLRKLTTRTLQLVTRCCQFQLGSFSRGGSSPMRRKITVFWQFGWAATEWNVSERCNYRLPIEQHTTQNMRVCSPKDRPRSTANSQSKNSFTPDALRCAAAPCAILRLVKVC